MTAYIIVGADEVGRGLVIGPLIIGLCALDENKSAILRNLGVKDSKEYSSNKKITLHAELIKKHSLAWEVKVVSADILNKFYENKMTMDELEAYTFYQALEEIIKKVSIVDEYQIDNFQAAEQLKSLLAKKDSTKNIKLMVSPKADKTHIAVSAGSILARVKLLEELEKIKKKYGDFGSGSTSDKKTINWLVQLYQKNHEWPMDIIRIYWKTIKSIEKEID